MTKRRRWLRFTAHAARGAGLLARAHVRSKVLRDHEGAVRDAERGVVAMGDALAVLGRPKPDRCSVRIDPSETVDIKVGDLLVWSEDGETARRATSARDWSEN